MALQAPKNPDRLPSLYAMKDNNGERHWRRTLEEVQILIERNASPD